MSSDGTNEEQAELSHEIVAGGGVEVAGESTTAMPPALATDGALAQTPLAPVVVGADGSLPGIPVEGAPVAWPPRPPVVEPPTAEEDAAPAKPLADALPFIAPREVQAPAVTTEAAQEWQQRIDTLVKEARAQGQVPAAAPLWFEAGRIYEAELGRLREAATHYGEANKADPTFLPVIHAARRLFAQLGKWGMVVYLIDQELKLEGAPRAALLVEKGRIHETKLAQAAEAVAFYREALAQDAAYGPAVENVVRHLRRAEEWSGIVDVLEQAVAASGKVSQRVAWLVDLGRLAESRLADDKRALGYYEAARRLAPSRKLILTALRRLYARGGDELKLAETLGALAAQTRSATEAMQYHLRRAQILVGRGDDQGAIAALEAAMGRVPSDTLVLAEAARLYERHEAWGSLVDVLESQAKATHDTSEKVALFAEAGKMAEERLVDAERAVLYYYACIEQDPTYQPALSALGKLYARSKRWRELADVFDVQIRATNDDGARVPLLYKLAELLQERLFDDNGAIERLRAVLAIAPGYVPALKLISTLYGKQQRWMDLIEMYEAELKDQGDKDQAIYLLERVASLYETQLGNPEQAIEAFKRMLGHSPSYLPALRNLGRLFAQTGRWEDLIGINTEEGQIIGDQSHVVALLYRNGEIYEEKLGRPDDAIDCYRHALTLLPNYLPALRALGRMYAKEQRWHDLIDMHREEAFVARTPQLRAQLLCSIAELYASKLDDQESAAKCYHEVITELPTYHPAIRALSRIAQQTGDFQGLVDTLTSELSVLHDPRDRALMRCRIAELLDRQLTNQEEAARMYEDAIRESPGLLTAHEQLVALSARRGDDAGEVGARERMHDVVPDIDGRVANLRVLGELYLYRLDDTDKALKAYERLLSERADDRAALRSSIDCSLRLRDYQAAIRHTEALAAVETTADEVANLYLQVATWKESHLDPPEDPLKSYLRALEYDPLNPVALRAVEKAYVERGEFDGLFQLYERERGGTEVPSRVADLSMKMGEIAERRLGNVALAATQFEVALKAQPDLLPAIARLKECYAQLGRPEDQLRMLAFEANASKDDDHAIKTLLEVGTLQRDKFQNVEAAADSFEQVLRRQPHHAQAFAELEQLFTASSRWAQLGELFAKKAAATSEPTTRVDLWLRAAHVLIEKLQVEGVSRALELYEEVLNIQPAHPTALAQVGNLSFGLRRFERARDAYLQLLHASADANVQAAVSFSLGVIFQDYLPDADRAAEHLEACLKVQPNNKEALLRLAKASVARGLMPSALRAYQTLLSLAQAPDEQLTRHLAIAELYENGFKEAAQAAAAYERALAVATDPAMQADLLAKAGTLYQRTGNLDGYLNVASKHAATVRAQDPRRAAELMLRNAQLALEHNQDERRALELADEGLRYAPDHPELMALVADLVAKDASQAARAIELHRRLLSTGVVRRESLHALYGAWTATKAPDRAFVAAEILKLLSATTEDEEIDYAARKSKVPVDTEEALTLDQLSSWVVHPAQRNVVFEILSACSLELTKLDAHDLGAYRVDKKEIFKAKSAEPLRRLCDVVAQNLCGGLSFDVHRTTAKPHIVAAHHAATPALVVGSEVTRAYQTREQRFLLGRGLMALRSGHHVIRDMSAADVAALLSAIGRSVDKAFPALRDHPELDALTKKVSASLSRQTKKQLAEPTTMLLQQWSHIDLARYLAAIPMTEARAGLALCGSFPVAARLYARHRGTLLAEDPEMLVASLEADAVLNDLFVYALSDEHFATRQALRFAIEA